MFDAAPRKEADNPGPAPAASTLAQSRRAESPAVRRERDQTMRNAHPRVVSPDRRMPIGIIGKQV